MKHRVTIGKDNKLYGLMEDLHEEGETVTFSFYYRTDTNYHVTSSQVRINCEGPQSDGKLLYTLDLRVDQTRTVDSSFGTNVITVSGGKIAVTEATCPDHYCMKRGFCSGGAQIVCLPNRLVIRFGGTPEIDAAVG